MHIMTSGFKARQLIFRTFSHNFLKLTYNDQVTRMLYQPWLVTTLHPKLEETNLVDHVTSCLRARLLFAR